MNEPYLIAHKVHGEPAFDVAIQIDCPECMDAGGCNYGCEECDQLGYWWIIPTSGHRAYPYWNVALSNIDDTYELGLHFWRDLGDGDGSWPPEMPPSLPDHYAHKATPTTDLATALGLRGARPQPSLPFPRRQL